MTGDRRTWHDEAACRDMETALFYSEAAGTIAQAKAVCGRCPVSDACLAEALAVPLWADHGIWAGTTRAQRADLRGRTLRPKLRRPIAHGTNNGYQAHLRRKEATCEPCAAAHRQYLREAWRTRDRAEANALSPRREAAT